MKRILIAGLFVSFVSMLSYKAWGQDTLPVKTLPPITITATTKTVPEKVWKNFRNYFTQAEDPKWYMLNKNYLVKFMMDDNVNRALFTKRGSLVYHITYGYEKNLPEDVRKQVKGTYYDYNITSAIRVSEADRVIWVVNLEDQKNLVLVRVEEGEMEEVQRVEKT